MTAILTDTTTSTVFATLSLITSSLNVGANAPQINSSITLQIAGTQNMAIPSPTTIYSLKITDETTPPRNLSILCISYFSKLFI